MVERLDADYLVVGAGAAGMAFADALVAHSGARVAIVDRRPAPGGHWLDAYPFVRLHQASSFYGVGSTLLGTGAIQQEGPEAGLHERATAPEILAYFEHVLEDVLEPTGQVTFYAECDDLGGGAFESLETGERWQAGPDCRIVDARYLAPEIPALSPPPFTVVGGAHVVPVGELPEAWGEPSEFVVVGSGKTATDAVVWLLGEGVDPDDIRWVRPRDPWMLSRAVVQPDPAVFIGMAATVMELAKLAPSPDALFLAMEEAGIMLRVDRSVLPTMAKTPTLAPWELELLRSIEQVVRLGHVRGVRPGLITLAEGDVAIARDALVVHCAAPGFTYPPLVPIWRPEAITLQPVRAGFPCLGAALIGYVEATRARDAEKNRVCRPSPLSNTPQDWALMQLLGGRSAAAFGAEPDIKAYADTLALNPARIPPTGDRGPALDPAVDRFRAAAPAGLEALARTAGVGTRSGG